MKKLSTVMRKVPTTVLAVVSYLLLTSNIVLGCSCMPKASIRTALKESAAVFSGRVVSIERNPSAGSFCECLDCCFKVVFAVDKAWKNIYEDVAIVFTGTGETDCGYTFEAGETYLIYASKDNNGRLTTNTCSRTTKLANASAEVKKLGRGKNIRKRYRSALQRRPSQSILPSPTTLAFA